MLPGTAGRAYRADGVNDLTLVITPIDLDEACAWVDTHHRHHDAPVGHKFSIAVSVDALRVAGVVMVGRPVSKHQQDGWTLEVTRCCTDGTRNACSILYRAAWRASRELGFRRLITYTLPCEGGASLRAAGFTLLGERRSGNWNVKSRPRIDTSELLQGQKLLWQLL